MVFAGSVSAAEATEAKPDSPLSDNDRPNPNDHPENDINSIESDIGAALAGTSEDRSSLTAASADERETRLPPTTGFRPPSPERGESGDEQRRSLSALLKPSTPAANDDQESIGALVKALGARESWTPIIGATIATAFWLFCLLSLYAERDLSNSEVVVFGLCVTGVYAILLLMIAVFTRSVESHATTRNLVKVVAGMANPELVAANKVGAISQIVKGEMSSIDNSLDRTLARAAQLESLLKSEYLDFERSFADNEHRLQGFIDSLSNERAAIVANAEKVRGAISGSHQNLSRDLDSASAKFTLLVSEASLGLAAAIDQKSVEMVKAASSASDKCAARLDSALEGSIIRASDLVDSRGDKFAALLSSKGNDLDEKLSARMKDASDLLERQIKDAQDKAAFRVDAMATQIDKLLKKMDNSIGERGEAINAMLATRTIDISKTLKETGNEFKQTLDLTAAFTDDFVKKAHSINSQLDQQVGRLSEHVVIPLESVTAALDEKGRTLSLSLADRFTTIDSMLTAQSNRMASVLDREIDTLKVTLDSSIDAMRAVLGSGSSELKSSVADRAQKIEAVLSERLSAFSALITENRARLAFELSSHTQSLDHMLDRQRALLTDLADPRNVAASAPIKIGTDRKNGGGERNVQFSTISASIREQQARSAYVSPPRTANGSSPLRDRLSAIDSVPSSSRAFDNTPAPARERQYANVTTPTAGQQVIASTPIASNVSLPAPASAKTPVPAEAPRTSLTPSKVAGPDGTSATASKTWLSDLLARASVDEDASSTQLQKSNYQDAPISSIAANVGNFIKPDELQKSWERYNTGGGGGDFQNIYTPKGAVMQHKIRQRLVEDVELRQAVNSYVTEFERLLQEVHQDNGDDVIFEYLHTDAGKVYTMLAHASNRLSGTG